MEQRVCGFLRVIEEKQQMEQIWQYGQDFIVAGAYGHTRLGKWIFNGFTQSPHDTVAALLVYRALILTSTRDGTATAVHGL
jgi:hypothetical protein